MTTVGIGFMWGLTKEKPVLPPGYTYIEGYREWLLAIGPNGRRYYVTRNTLYRQGVRPISLAYYVECDETIKLPQKQLT